MIPVRNTAARFVFVAGVAVCAWPETSAALALLGGIALAMTLGNPFPDKARHVAGRLLPASVVGLGAGMNVITVLHVGAQGIVYTLISIACALTLGVWLGRWLHTERTTSLLMTIGTAICGGSAIAATAPVLRAKPYEISVALATVFILNAAALLIFPSVGHFFDLTQRQFGLWSALAIHDTSSVVGAGLRYGAEALQVGTTVKLARALWIVPLTLGLGWLERRRQTNTDGTPAPKRPWFILGFLVVATVVTFVPALQEAGHWVETIAKRMLVLTLFLIGSGLSRDAVQSVGIKPWAQGVLLWLVMAGGSLAVIKAGWIGG